jgi:hypothetical protein
LQTAASVQAKAGLLSIEASGMQLSRRTLLIGAAQCGILRAGCAATGGETESRLSHAASPEDFGAVGANSVADTAAFLAFQRWASSLPADRQAQLTCKPGRRYQIADPKWSQGIRNLVVNGNGCTLVNSASSNRDKYLLQPARGTSAYGPDLGYRPVRRCLIGTTREGDHSVTCLTPAEAANFSPGEMVMVASYDIQFGGQPSNYMYFEYHAVQSVDHVSGVVALAGAVKYRHQSNFPYKDPNTWNAKADGRAHIEKIEEGSLFNIHHVYNDISFVRNPVGSASAVTETVYCSGRYVEFNRCTAEYFMPSVADTVVLNQCKFTGTPSGRFEIDKLVARLTLNACQISGRPESATSVLEMQASNTKFEAGYWIAPRQLTLTNCEVEAASADDVKIFSAYGSLRRLQILGGVHRHYPKIDINLYRFNSSPTAWNPSSSLLTVDLAVPRGRALVAKLFPGRLLHCVNLYNSAYFSIGVYGVVKEISGTADVARVRVVMSSPIRGDEMFTVLDEPEKTNIQQTRTWLAWCHSEFVQENLRVTPGLLQPNMKMFGKPKRLLVDVKKPYTGQSSTAAQLQIYGRYPGTAWSRGESVGLPGTLRVYGDHVYASRNAGTTGGDPPIHQRGAVTDGEVVWAYVGSAFRLNRHVDLRVAGRREATLTSSSGWAGSSAEPAGEKLGDGTFEQTCLSHFEISASSHMNFESEDQLAVVDIRLELESPYDGA